MLPSEERGLRPGYEERLGPRARSCDGLAAGRGLTGEVPEEFRRFFGGARPAGSLARARPAIRVARGCYGGNVIPGTLTGYSPALGTPVGHFAGLARRPPGSGQASWRAP